MFLWILLGLILILILFVIGSYNSLVQLKQRVKKKNLKTKLTEQSILIL